MQMLLIRVFLLCTASVAAVCATGTSAPPCPLTIVYPADGTVFPPDMAAPLFIWRDQGSRANRWRISTRFDGDGPIMQSTSEGNPPAIGPIDPRVVSPTNQPPTIPPEFVGAHAWRPDPTLWDEVKRLTASKPASVIITGHDGSHSEPLSRASIRFSTSRDPVGAPIFYRDVPLMPSESKKGTIKPLAPDAIRLIQWRIRDISNPESRVVLEGLPTCANCHSFSVDGRTLGMDLDGPDSDKGAYAISRVGPETTIARTDVMTWNSFPGRKPGSRTIGFMSQISPDGQFVVSTVNEELHTANFRDFRFLQVFYPTRGILAVYSRKTGHIEALPGADDSRYVHTNAVWSPDGKYLFFAKADARDPYPPGGRAPESANDPNELPVRYDLYRIPFNGGKGGQAEPIRGASGNGKSNSFPKVSPDGQWIVYVQSKNGQLMRPDSELFIVPAAGGRSRRMSCNTPLMNSWHSFSPNGRWMVFSSKSLSPYTQMFLTHIDENGNDSPAVLIENSTAANRAVNIPEFVNIAPESLLSIDVPAAEFYRIYDKATEATNAGDFDGAIALWTRALLLEPDDARVHNNLGVALASRLRVNEAEEHFRKSIALKADSTDAHYNLGGVLARQGRTTEALASWERSVRLVPGFAGDPAQAARELAAKFPTHSGLDSWRNTLTASYNSRGATEAELGHFKQAETLFLQALEINPNFAEANYNLGRLHAQRGELDAAVARWARALESRPSFAEAHFSVADVETVRGNWSVSLRHWLEGLNTDPDFVPALKRAAWLMAAAADQALHDKSRAIELAKQAVRLTQSKDAVALDVLAAAYARAGQFEKAQVTARAAIALSSGKLAEEIRRRLSCYERHSAWTEQPTPHR